MLGSSLFPCRCPTQLDGILDHEFVERVFFDMVNDLRDGVVEKHGRAMKPLLQPRDRVEGSDRHGGDSDAENERFEHVCPGCDGHARSVAWAFQRGEPCPVCALPPDVAAVISDARLAG